MFDVQIFERRLNIIGQFEMKKVGNFVKVSPKSKNVITEVQGLTMERASPSSFEMCKIGSFVAMHGNDAGGYTITSLGSSVPVAVDYSPKLIPIGANYRQGPDGYYISLEEDAPKRMTDFVMEIPYVERRCNIDGSIDVFYHVEMLDEDGKVHVLLIGENEWSQLASIIDNRLPMCQIFYDAVPQAGLKFKRLAGLVLKKATPEVRTVQTYWGWGERRQDGTRAFYHGGRIDCISPKKLFPAITDGTERRQRLKKALLIFEVGPHSVTFPTVVYSLAAYLDAPFTDADFPLNFSVMAVGDSGFLKSAYFKVIFSPCVFPADNRLHNIRGTEAAMNKLHQETFDDVLFIDDFNNEGTPKDVQRKMQLLRASIRDFSDKSAREKYGSDGEIVKYAIRGGCVITGETRLTGQIRSAELRYLAVRFPGLLDGETLRVFQKDPSLFGFFVSEFIRFAEAHYAGIVRLVESRISVMRTQTGVKSLRLSDAYIFLALTAEIIANFWMENDVLLPEEATAWLQEATQIFLALVKEQVEGANQRDPYIRYIEEIFNLIGTGKLRIASSLETYVANIGHYCGYSDDGLLMLKKDEAYALVSAAFASRNEYLPLGTDDVSRLLKEHNLSKCDEKSCLKKASSKIPGRPRMLALIKEQCEKIMEGIKNGTNSSNL